MEKYEVCSVWRSMQYAVCVQEEYAVIAVCSVCEGGLTTGSGRQPPTLLFPTCLPSWCSTFPRFPFFGVRHKSDFWSLSSCVWEEDKGVTESHTDAVLDRLTYDGQEEEKEGNTHTSPSILCSWAWLPARPTMRASTPRAAKALRALTMFRPQQ